MANPGIRARFITGYQCSLNLPVTTMQHSRKVRILKIMFAINIFAAGIPGFLIVLFPLFAEQHVLWEGQDKGVMMILGSIWLSIGAVSIAGVFRPFAFVSVFVIQFLYKTIWLVSFVVPALLAYEPLPPASFIITGLFVVLIIECLLFIRPEDFKVQHGPSLTNTVS